LRFIPDYVALTPPCGLVQIKGVPLGMLTPTPVEIASGCPFDVTRTVPVTHWALTHGGSGGGTRGQPATTHCADSSTVGTPLTVTAGFGEVATAWPPWLHITVVPIVSSEPDIA
jgi:hypothetical protein